MLYALANPRRRSYHHRRRRRHNPEPVSTYAALAANPRYRHHRRRRNPGLPSIGGASVEEAGGAILGMVGTAYVDTALAKPLLGGLVAGLGQWSSAVTGILSAWGLHQLVRPMSPYWGRRTAVGGATYATIAIANSLAPGLVPITVGVPSQLAGFNPLAGLGVGAAPAKPALAGGGPAGTVSSQTGGLRIVSRMGL